MTQQEFETFVKNALSELIVYAETRTGKMFPKELIFNWGENSNTVNGEDEIVKEIVEKIYLDSDNIYPCVDIYVDHITSDNKLNIVGRIAGHKPRPMQIGWSGRYGPFIYGISKNLIS